MRATGPPGEKGQPVRRFVPAATFPTVLAGLVLCLSPRGAIAQVPVPGAVPTAAGSPTLWTFLGVDQIFVCVGRTAKHLSQKPLVKTVCNTLVNPMLHGVGLKAGPAGPGGPGSPVAAVPGGPPTAVALAGQIAAANNPVNVQLKVKAIRYLGKVDCICYPEVVDALLASLDDCAEPVRYEALRALQKGCTAGGCAACYDPVARVNSPPCACQTRVIVRLSDLLLVRDANGQMLERSARVRRLATQMLQHCLRARPIQQPEQPAPIRPQPDPTFDDLPLPPLPAGEAPPPLPLESGEPGSAS